LWQVEMDIILWSMKIYMRMKWKRPENIPTCIETLDGRRRDILSETAAIHRTHRWPTIFGISSFLNLNDEWFIFSHYLIKCFSLSMKLNGNKEKQVRYVINWIFDNLVLHVIVVLRSKLLRLRLVNNFRSLMLTFFVPHLP